MFEVYFQLSVHAFNLNPVSHGKTCREERKATFTFWLLGLIQTNKALELKRDCVMGFLFHVSSSYALCIITLKHLFSPALSLIRLQQLQRGVPHLSRHSAFSAKFTSCNLRVKQCFDSKSVVARARAAGYYFMDGVFCKDSFRVSFCSFCICRSK